jgi:signal transduction histidine kinase
VTEQDRTERRRNRKVRRYVAACATVAAGVVLLVWTVPPATAHVLGPVWVLPLLFVVTVVAGRIEVSISHRGVGGVPEYASLADLAAVLLIVFLAPSWAVGIAVVATVVTEAGVLRRETRKVVFNTASEAISIGLAALVYHALVGVGFAGTPGPILAALLAGALYVLLNTAVFAGLVGVLSDDPWPVFRSSALPSSVLVDAGIVSTGVIAAVLVVEAPVALPLLLAPMLFDRLLGRVRQESLELTAAKGAAEQASRAKSEFLSGMSHELRTPLNAVLGFGQLLETDDELTDEAREYATLIVASGRHLLRIIEDALDISQIEAGRLPLDLGPIEVEPLATQVLGLLRPMADARRLRLEAEIADDLPPAEADAQRLRQVLLNLGGNAVKYNRDGGEVVVRARHDGEHVAIEVCDTGEGIAEADLDRLFLPFERLHARDRDVEGTGLGLSVSLHLVEAMGGTLSVDSSPDGTTFTLRLPVAAQTTAVG